MTINTHKFDTIEISAAKVITFPSGILGFEELKSFIILKDDELEPFLFLQAVGIGSEDVALTIMNPFEVLDEYLIDVDESVYEELEIDEDDEILVLSVVVVPSAVKNMTANFMAPIIINATKRIGKQVILQDEKYSLRHPIFEILKNKPKSMKDGV